MGLLGFLKGKSEKLIAIDFGKTAAKIAYLEAVPSGIKLLNYDLITASIEGNKEELLKQFIVDFLKANSIENKDVYLNISLSDNVAVKYLSLPVLPKEEMLEAAKWQLKEEITFDLGAASLDWQIVREYSDEDTARKNGIIFVAAKKETIDKYVSIVKSCNLNPVGITTGIFNYANLFDYYPKSPAVVAILDIGNKDAALGVYNGGKLNFVRRMVFSLEKLTQSLSGSFFGGKSKVEISLEEAQGIINTVGIPQDTSQIIKENIQASQVIPLIRPHLEALARELKSSFDYAGSNLNIEYPALLYITGGGANLKNLNTYLAEKLNIKVAYLPLPDCVNIQAIEKEKLEKDNNQLINVLSTLLKGRYKVNLLPHELKTQKSEFIQKVSLRLTGITVGVVFLFLLFAAKFQVNDYTNRLKSAHSHLQTVLPIESLQQKISLKQDVVSKIQNGVVPAEGILKLLSVLTPAEIVLDELTLEQPNHDLVIKGTVSLGENAAESVLVNFMQQLEESLFITEASLMFSEKTSGTQKFGIKCELIH